MNKRLGIVMPVYNEEEALPGVLREWQNVLRSIPSLDFYFILVNDGSTDATLRVIKECQLEYKNIEVINKSNGGHGSACFVGYQFALEMDYEYICQIDSDGQCDPKYFKGLWQQFLRKDVDVLYCRRIWRHDGFLRFFVSRVVSFFVMFDFKVFIFDPNVPYRIFKSCTIKNQIELFRGLSLINVYLSVFHNMHYKVVYKNIVFADRKGGSPSIKSASFPKWLNSYRADTNKFKKNMNTV